MQEIQMIKNKEKTLGVQASLSLDVAVGLVLETFPIEEFNPTKGGV